MMKAFVKSSLSHTHSFFFSLLPLSLSKCLRRWKCKDGRGFHMAHQNTSNEATGKHVPLMCLTDFREKAKTQSRVLIMHHDVTFHSHFSQEAVLHPGLLTYAIVCACFWLSEQKCGHLSRHRRLLHSQGSCWCVKMVFTDWLSVCHVLAWYLLHTFSCECSWCWMYLIDHKGMAKWPCKYSIPWCHQWFLPTRSWLLFAS